MIDYSGIEIKINRGTASTIAVLRFLIISLTLLFFNITGANGQENSTLISESEGMAEKSGATEERDSVFTILPDLIVKEQGKSQFIKLSDGSIKIDAHETALLHRSFGEADVINQLKQLTGISTNGDYSSGLSVDGADPAQTQYLIDGMPVIFPYRFGGIFSTFNTNHYSSFYFSRWSASDLPARVGGAVRMESASNFNMFPTGNINIGMTASSLTLRYGIKQRISLSLSGRISYVDEIYGPFLKSSRSYIKFSFRDLNASVAYRISSSDLLKANMLLSGDKVGYDDNHYALDTRLKWSNDAFGLNYSHKGELDISAIAYYSDFKTRLALEMPLMNLSAPSSLILSGCSVSIGAKDEERKINQWNAGLRGNWGRTIPQWTIFQSGGPDSGISVNQSAQRPQNLVDVAAFTSVSWPIMPGHLTVKGETSVGLFHSSGEEQESYSSLLISPSLSGNLNIPEGNVLLSFGLAVQPYHQVGFSELGLASNFWIGACRKAPIQRSFNVNLSAARRLPWFNLSIEAGAYYKRLWNQAEYRGEVIEIINTEYDPFSHLIISNGYNYGFSLKLSRNFGQLTGDISYSYGDGRRHLQQSRYWWRALYSEGNVLKVGMVWHEGNHWEISADFRVASGRPYTPVEAIYAIGGNIAIDYGRRNSGRLPLYQRLDLGASYYFSTGSKHRIRHIINFSLLNAYGHRNVEMQYFLLNSNDGGYALKRLYSLYRFLPSLSYSIDF